jgi:hypothetical protein
MSVVYPVAAIRNGRPAYRHPIRVDVLVRGAEPSYVDGSAAVCPGPAGAARSDSGTVVTSRVPSVPVHLTVRVLEPTLAAGASAHDCEPIAVHGDAIVRASSWPVLSATTNSGTVPDVDGAAATVGCAGVCSPSENAARPSNLADRPPPPS